MSCTYTPTLQQRTVNIIMCCKNNCKLLDENGEHTREDAIIAYLSRECGCPEWFYRSHPNAVRGVILEALYDYLNCAHRPGYVMKEIFADSVWFSPDLNVSLTDRICAMFAGVQVRDDSGCVNGFTEYSISQSETDLSPEKYKRKDDHDSP